MRSQIKLSSHILYLVLLLALLRLVGVLCSILGAASLAVLYTLGIQRSTNDVVAHAGEVLYAAPADQHYRVLLQVVTFAGNIGGHFHAVGEAHTGDLA